MKIIKNYLNSLYEDDDSNEAKKIKLEILEYLEILTNEDCLYYKWGV